MDNIIIAIAIITGVTEAIKKAGVSTRYIPLCAILLGIIYGVAVMGVGIQSVISGLIAGLSSVGLYRTGQKLIE
jgi:hypothetical protein